jgi:hypothetical protein
MALVKGELTHLWGSFSLRDDESFEVDIGETEMAPLLAWGAVCLVGKLLADRTMGKEVIKMPLIHAWQPSGWVTFKMLGNNMYLIEFEKEWDKIRILEGRPWTFDGHLVSLVDYDDVIPPSDLEFKRATFWVRMFRLPLACMGWEIGYKIGAMVGVVEDVDVNEDGVGWGEFLRVQIVLDLSKPLPRGMTIRVRDKAIWVAFQYEKIPKFCFKCGVIKHDSKGCGLTRGRRLYGGGTE